MNKTTVDHISARSTMKALVLPEHTPLMEAIDRFASNEGQHGIFLVNNDNRLTGVVNNMDLLDWARLQFDVMPGKAPLTVGKVRRLISAKYVSDLAVPNSERKSINLNETLADALTKMANYDLEDIAVVDNDGHIVNDLRLSEVLSFALHVERGDAPSIE